MGRISWESSLACGFWSRHWHRWTFIEFGSEQIITFVAMATQELTVTHRDTKGAAWSKTVPGQHAMESKSSTGCVDFALWPYHQHHISKLWNLEVLVVHSLGNHFEADLLKPALKLRGGVGDGWRSILPERWWTFQRNNHSIHLMKWTTLYIAGCSTKPCAPSTSLSILQICMLWYIGIYIYILVIKYTYIYILYHLLYLLLYVHTCIYT